MALNFPNTPQSGDTYTSGSTTWQFDGVGWTLATSLTTPVSIPNSFNTISVSGQDSIIADSNTDTLNIIAGSNIAITTDSGSDTITIASTASGGGSGEANQNAFSNIAVSGQTTVSASTTTDTFTLIGGSNITLVTDSFSKSITISGASGGGSSLFNNLTDASAAEITIDHLFEPALPLLRVDNVGTTAYVFNSHYTGNNPNLYALSGTTIGFDLTGVSGHPFEIQDPTSDPYNTGLYHVANDGTVSTGNAAQGKSSGTLYWRIPESISGNYRYQCQSHAAMVGAITIKRLSTL